MAIDIEKLVGGVVDAAKTSRAADITAAKTEVLTKVETEIVAKAIEDQTNGIAITELASKTEVSDAVATAKAALETVIATKADDEATKKAIKDVKDYVDSQNRIDDLLETVVVHDKIGDKIHAIFEAEAQEGNLYLKDAIDTKVTTLDGKITANATAITNLGTTIDTLRSDLEGSIGVVQDALSDHETAAEAKYATKTSVNNFISTLETNLTDQINSLDEVYAGKIDTEMALDDKLDTSVFNAYKTSNNTAVAAVKATADAAAVKATVDAKFETVEADISANATAIATKVSETDFDTFKEANTEAIATAKSEAIAALNSEVTRINAAIALKLDASTYTTDKAALDAAIAAKVATTDFNEFKTANTAAINGVDANVDALAEDVAENYLKKADAATTYKTVTAAAEDKTALETAIAAKVAQSAYDSDKADIEAGLANRYTKTETYTKAEVDAAIETAIANVLTQITAQINGTEDPE